MLWSGVHAFCVRFPIKSSIHLLTQFRFSICGSDGGGGSAAPDTVEVMVEVMVLEVVVMVVVAVAVVGVVLFNTSGGDGDEW